MIRVVVGLLVAGVLAVLLFPIFAGPSREGDVATCRGNLKGTTLAMAFYRSDNDERLPYRKTWMDDLFPYTKNDYMNRCPQVTQGYGHAMNSLLSRQDASKVEEPGDVPLVYDSSNLARNASDPFTSFIFKPRHKGGNYLGYLDTHVKLIKMPGKQD